MQSCPGNCGNRACGRHYHARAAHVLSAGIKCRHCSIDILDHELVAILKQFIIIPVESLAILNQIVPSWLLTICNRKN